MGILVAPVTGPAAVMITRQKRAMVVPGRMMFLPLGSKIQFPHDRVGRTDPHPEGLLMTVAPARYGATNTLVWYSSQLFPSLGLVTTIRNVSWRPKAHPLNDLKEYLAG